MEPTSDRIVELVFRAVDHAPQQFGGRRPDQGLVDRVGVGEPVVDDVPVAVVILDVEAGDAQAGREGEGPPELFG